MFKYEDIAAIIVAAILIAIFSLLLAILRPSMKPIDADRHNKNAAVADSLFEFDPNTASFEELLALGMTKTSAASVIRRRARGWNFSVPEEVAAIYGVDDSLYLKIKPYIKIAEQYRLPYRRDSSLFRESAFKKRTPVYKPFRIDTVGVAFLQTIGFSERQAVALLNYRDACGGFYSIDEVGRSFVVDSALRDTLEKYIIFPEREESYAAATRPVEINSADSAALRSIHGIGEKSVADILDYRRRLGGFRSVGQLAEVKSVTESNFEKILTQICCDSCIISKIDINFAHPKRLLEHPYISARALRKITSIRQKKGGWSNIEEMVGDNIFTRDEAERLRPYLRFTRDSL